MSLRRQSLVRILRISSILASAIFIAGSAAAQGQHQCLALPLPAECESFEFDIELTSVTDPFGIFGSVISGDVVSGTYTVFTGFPDLDLDANEGFYLNAVECVRLDLGDRVLTVVHEPVELTAEPTSSDPGVGVKNDIPEVAGPFTLFTDAVTFGMAGPGAFNLQSTPIDVDLFGAGGFAFAYSSACISGVQTPCPPTIVTDESIPPAPGDTTVLTSSLMTIQFQSLTGMNGTLQSDLLAIDPAAPIPCPEPGMAGALMAGTALLVTMARRR